MTFALRLFTAIKKFLGDHKKKLIGLMLLGLVAYFIKRRMTLEHLMHIVEKVLSFAEYLPLPDPPVYRQVQPIPRSQPATHACLKAFINIQDIKQRIKNKQGQQWDRLKLNVLSGYAFSVSLFDLTEVLNVVEAKYIEQFRSIDAEVPYRKAISIVLENYRQNMSSYFQFMKTTLQSAVEAMDITREYTKEELYGALANITERIFSELYSVNHRRRSRKNRNIVGKEAQRLFYTQLQKIEDKKPSRFRLLWNKLGELLTFETSEREYQSSLDRFRVVKEMVTMEYSMGNRLTMLFELNSDAQQLFDLVFREFEDLMESINFNSLVYYYAQYQTNRFINRLELYLMDRKQEKIKLASALSVIYKIIVEEYLPEESWTHNQVFLSNEIKEAFKILRVEKEEELVELNCTRNNLILTELQAERRIDFAKNEFLLKYYHERSGIDAMKDTTENMDFEAKELLSFMSKEKQ